MELEKFARQLRLMVLLTQNYTMTIEEVGQKLCMSRRTIYRYIDAFKNMGFIVKKEGSRYRLDPLSPFFRDIASDIQFSEDEALTISQVLNSVYDNSFQVRALREKLAKLYDTEVLARHGVDNHVAQNITTIFQAIRQERILVLKDYRSGSSNKVSNRIVEPYMFINQNNEVRCFELTTNMNKTFKISRIGSTEMLDLLWSHKSDHAPFFNDLFGFTGEQRIPVSLVLGQLATNVLLEEYPDAQRQLSPTKDGCHRLDTEVCSYLGIGRFVLSLYEDIKIVDSPEFADYMKRRIAKIASK